MPRSPPISQSCCDSSFLLLKTKEKKKDMFSLVFTLFWVLLSVTEQRILADFLPISLFIFVEFDVTKTEREGGMPCCCYCLPLFFLDRVLIFTALYFTIKHEGVCIILSWHKFILFSPTISFYKYNLWFCTQVFILKYYFHIMWWLHYHSFKYC